MCFPVKFGKSLKTPFFHRTPPVAASLFSILILGRRVLFILILQLVLTMVKFSRAIVY